MKLLVILFTLTLYARIRIFKLEMTFTIQSFQAFSSSKQILLKDF